MSEGDQDQSKGGVDALIDQNLKLMYKDLIDEGLPDHFRDLLAVIKAEDMLKSQNGDDK